jgi:hypothetical protein
LFLPLLERQPWAPFPLQQREEMSSSAREMACASA